MYKDEFPQGGGELHKDYVHRGSAAARDWLQSHNFPYSDSIELKASGLEFPGGGHYAVEIPVINSFEALSGTVKALKEEGIPCTRFNETLGSHLLSDNEIKDMLSLSAENGYGFVFSLGPRPEYDRKASFYRTKFGLEQGRSVNNNDAITACVDEALRLSELGCRGAIVYDLGVMRVLSEMRKAGALPKDMYFKASSHCVVSNPVTALIWAEQGVDSVTVLHDVDVSVLQEMRRMAPNVVLDVPIDVYPDKGWFIRFHEVAEITQVCAPVMLKMGASAQSNPYDNIGQSTVTKRVKRVALGLEYLARSGVTVNFAEQKAPYWCMPAL